MKQNDFGYILFEIYINQKGQFFFKMIGNKNNLFFYVSTMFKNRFICTLIDALIGKRSVVTQYYRLKFCMDNILIIKSITLMIDT